MSLSSPNRMVWSCFRSLRRNVSFLEEESDKNTIKDVAAVSVLMAVTAVETFVNMYFRVLVEDDKYKKFKAMLVEDLTNEEGGRAKGLEQKLNSWPNQILNKNINFDKGIPKEFDELRILRNNLTHITTNYESIKLEGIEIRGLANTDMFDSLKKEDGEKALRIAKDFIEHVLSLSVNKVDQPNAMHYWIGFVPEGGSES